MTTHVTNAASLAEAVASGERDIQVEGTISGSPMITLLPGTTLRGGTLQFGAKGVRLTSGNTLQDVTVLTTDTEQAVLNDTSVADLGTITLRRVTVRGQVAILGQDSVMAGHVVVDGLRIIAADVRGRADRPHAFGVDALQGGFTLWNRQADAKSVITAELTDISGGSPDEPIRGSGVFVGGHGDESGRADGGVVRVSTLTTGELHTDGGIAPATPDLISGGVFVITGATVDTLTNIGPVTTYGQNDMVLDNWGTVTTWIAESAVTSHGASGIGFVQFGDIELLDVRGPIATHGGGARGFNLYDGTLKEARIESIQTTADGSVGVQISKPMGSLKIANDVSTTGGEGSSLVKGVQTTLQAMALSVKKGGDIDEIVIGGSLRTQGDHLRTLEVEAGGRIGRLEVGGEIVATGQDSDAAVVVDGGVQLDGVRLRADHGKDQVLTDKPA